MNVPIEWLNEYVDIKGKTPKDWRRATYYHYFSGYGIPEHHGVRTKRYKLLHFPEFENVRYFEFFDLKKDPHELNNTYSDPANSKRINELKELLLEVKH